MSTRPFDPELQTGPNGPLSDGFVERLDRLHKSGGVSFRRMADEMEISTGHLEKLRRRERNMDSKHTSSMLSAVVRLEVEAGIRPDASDAVKAVVIWVPSEMTPTEGAFTADAQKRNPSFARRTFAALGDALEYASSTASDDDREPWVFSDGGLFDQQQSRVVWKAMRSMAANAR